MGGMRASKHLAYGCTEKRDAHQHPERQEEHFGVIRGARCLPYVCVGIDRYMERSTSVRHTKPTAFHANRCIDR